jgi:hypothetical protein
VIEVMVIHEVPVIEVTVMELPTRESGSTMESTNGKTTHMATHGTNMTTGRATQMGAESAHMTAKPATTATADRHNRVVKGADSVLEFRRACYRLS